MWLFTADTSFPPTNLKYTPFELCVHRGNAFLCLQTMQLTVVNSLRSGHVCVTFNYVFILYEIESAFCKGAKLIFFHVPRNYWEK